MGVVPVCDDITSSTIHWLRLLPNFVDIIIITLCGSVCICIISLIQRLIATCITKTLHRKEHLWLLWPVLKNPPCKYCGGCVCLFTEKQGLWHHLKAIKLACEQPRTSWTTQSAITHYTVVFMASSFVRRFNLTGNSMHKDANNLTHIFKSNVHIQKHSGTCGWGFTFKSKRLPESILVKLPDDGYLQMSYKSIVSTTSVISCEACTSRSL